MKRGASGLRVIAAWALVLTLAARAGAAPASNCLWRVSGPAGVVYLQGSLHMLKAGDYPLSPAIEEAFRASTVLALETDLDEAEGADTRQLFARKGVLPPGQTLDGALSPQTYALAVREAGKLGVDMRAAARFKPWLFCVALTAAKLQSLGFKARYGVDAHFNARARQAGKRVIALETPAEQIALFDGLSAVNQEQLVRQTLADFGVLEGQMAEIVAAWRSGDAAGLEKTLLASFADYPDLLGLFVTARNRRWLARIEELLREPGTSMVVVGAGHLVGKEGLPSLLRARGHRVEHL